MKVSKCLVQCIILKSELRNNFSLIGTFDVVNRDIVFDVVNRDIVFDFVNPFLSKRFPIDE